MLLSWNLSILHILSACSEFHTFCRVVDSLYLKTFEGCFKILPAGWLPRPVLLTFSPACCPHASPSFANFQIIHMCWTLIADDRVERYNIFILFFHTSVMAVMGIRTEDHLANIYWTWELHQFTRLKISRDFENFFPVKLKCFVYKLAIL